MFTSLLAVAFLSSDKPTKVKTARYLLLPGAKVKQHVESKANDRAVDDDDNEDDNDDSNEDAQPRSTHTRGKRGQKVRLQAAAAKTPPAKKAKAAHPVKDNNKDADELSWLCNGKRMTMANHLVREIPVVDKLALHASEPAGFEVVDLKSGRWSVVKV